MRYILIGLLSVALMGGFYYSESEPERLCPEIINLPCPTPTPILVEPSPTPDGGGCRTRPCLE